MTARDDMSNCTEKLPLKLSSEDHASLHLIAGAREVDMQTVAREFIHEGIQRARREYMRAHRLLNGEEIAGKSRGHHE